MRRLVLVLGFVPLLSAGCGVLLGGTTVYGNLQYEKQVKAGEAPPLSLVHQCQLGTTGPEQVACLKASGWQYDVEALRWRRVQN